MTVTDNVIVIAAVRLLLRLHCWPTFNQSNHICPVWQLCWWLLVLLYPKSISINEAILSSNLGLLPPFCLLLQSHGACNRRYSAEKAPMNTTPPADIHLATAYKYKAHIIQFIHSTIPNVQRTAGWPWLPSFYPLSIGCVSLFVACDRHICSWVPGYWSMPRSYPPSLKRRAPKQITMLSSAI